MTSATPEIAETLARLRDLAARAVSEEEARLITARITKLTKTYRRQAMQIPRGPVEQAMEIESRFRLREHLAYISDRIAVAVADVEQGRNRMLAISAPPRSGKSVLTSEYTPLWLLRKHPEWNIMLASYDPALSTGWARTVRTLIETQPDLGITLAPDGGAAGSWSTIQGGGVFATSLPRGALTGHGGSCLFIDDPVKDFVEAHSPVIQRAIWDWWLSVAQTRLEPPFLVVTIMTRWTADDFLGRIFSTDYEGDPALWEKISLPALAEPGDVLGRAEGEPLVSPLLDETSEQALERWGDVRRAVGSYTWAGMYQQRPAPARGAIFDIGWWRFWTSDPSRATEDGRVVYLDPSTLSGGRWLDSWDTSFKSTADSDWVVGQRWVRSGPTRYLIAQRRGRWAFTKTIEVMNDFRTANYGRFVHQILIEEKANGSAIIDVLKDKVAGIKPINPTTSKEARARAVTPECESGHVRLPYPGDPGMEWVTDLLSELRAFPHDTHDDQVDGLTQALSELRDEGHGSIAVPGRRTAPLDLDRARAARTERSRLSSTWISR